MSRLLLVISALSMVVAMAQGYCMIMQAEGALDPVTFRFRAFCKLEDGTKKDVDETWTDNVKCEQCKCGGQCCGFGWSMRGVIHMEKNGETCEAVRIPPCGVKFVLPSDHSVVC